MQNAAKISPTNFRVTSVLGRNGKGTKRPGTKRQGDETTIKRFDSLYLQGTQNLSPNYKLDNKTKRFDDENVVLALFILCSLHSWPKFKMAHSKGHAR